jgi:hypothetical protein
MLQDLLGEPKMFKKKNDDKPPKFAVANSFGIDHFPDTFKFKNKNSEVKIHSIDAEWDLCDLICAAINTVRPFCHVHAYLLEVRSQSKVTFLCSVLINHTWGALNKNRSTTVAKSFYAVLCGRMTPVQNILFGG